MLNLESLEASGQQLRSRIDERDAERQAWLEKRRGMFTCSVFPQLMTMPRSKDDKFSRSAWSVIYRVAAERLGSHAEELNTRSTAWGHEHEEAAYAEYHSRMDQPLTLSYGVSNWTRVSGYAGGTPDVLVWESEIDAATAGEIKAGVCQPVGCVEIKCPISPEVHMRYVMEGGVPGDYRWQVVGHAMVTSALWVDFVSFDPRIPGPGGFYCFRWQRDEESIELLHRQLIEAELEVRRIVEAMGGAE